MITQTHIAKIAGISQQRVSQIIMNGQRPSWDVAEKLAEIFPETDEAFWMKSTAAERRHVYANAKSRSQQKAA